jgi:NAD(P)H-nitrite reductase large subunit
MRDSELDMIVCRCEEITMREILHAIEMGAVDITGVKRRTRAGMGTCQGRTCERLVSQIIRQQLGANPDLIGYSTPRTPTRLVTLGVLAGREDDVLEP